MWVKQQKTTHDWEWFIPPAYGEMVYDCFTHIIATVNHYNPYILVDYIILYLPLMGINHYIPLHQLAKSHYMHINNH